MAIYTQVLIVLRTFQTHRNHFFKKIIFATIFERIFFHTYPTFYSAIGIVLITGSALYTAVRFKR